jgi:fatty acid desaturase
LQVHQQGLHEDLRFAIMAPINTSQAPELNHPEVQRRVNALRATDNVTNWLFLAREYLFFGTVLALTIGFYQYRSIWGLAWAWNVPVSLLAIFLVGVGQHRLVQLGHEGSHYALFRNRRLNELASDWFCMFPIWSVTNNYRIQHLAHHQYVNDPQRDPDLHFMEESGHHFPFPMSRRRFFWSCVVKTLVWVPGLIRYMRIRSRHINLGTGVGPYAPRGPRSRLLIPVGIAYILTLMGVLTALTLLGDPWLLAGVPAALLALILAFYGLVPARHYPQSLIKPDVSRRCTTLLRMIYITLVFTGLAWLTYATGQPWPLYYLVLWVVPLATTFAFLMILREGIQHGALGQERFLHTRLFDGNPLIRFAVFPLGMDYHLPHHLFPMVPHYRLKQLHTLLAETQPYREVAPGFRDCFLPRQPAADPANHSARDESPVCPAKPC